MINIEQLEEWLNSACEHERLEFKEAAQKFEAEKVYKYCSAIANEGGGHLVLGVQDGPPKRKVVGTNAFSDIGKLNAIKNHIADELKIRVEVDIIEHRDGSVLVFSIPKRTRGNFVTYRNLPYMRCGESLRPMTQDLQRRILLEGEEDWLDGLAISDVSAAEVIELLDTQSYFDLLGENYPTEQSLVIEAFAKKEFIKKTTGGWGITNLTAISLAKRLSDFGHDIEKRAPRFIIYEGKGKSKTRNEITGQKGYIVGFAGLVDTVHNSSPLNKFIEEGLRDEIKAFPKLAVRELIANAFVHQDFLIDGSCIRIEMYDDRLEITNPGIPQIDIERFIDEDKARNEKLAELMRRLKVCERKGSGLDKVVELVELEQLPPPEFHAGQLQTTAILYAFKDFRKLSKEERIRACWQHCILKYVQRDSMSNKSLRERFGLNEKQGPTVSGIISLAKEQRLIKPEDPELESTRYAKYIPYWA